MLKNSFLTLLLLILPACTTGPKEVKWDYPPVNPYPTVMKTIPYEDRVPSLVVELQPDSLELDCSLRNDSPYYWCGVSGLIQNPDPSLPKKVGTVYHRVIHKSKRGISVDFITRLKKAGKPVFLIAPTGYYIKDNEFGNLMFGIYNEDECMDLFRNFEACPKSSKKLDIFSGKYIKD